MPTEVSSARRHDRRQPALRARSRSAARDPAERRDLDHDDVGGLRAHHPHRVLGLADRLVGGDRHVDPAPGQVDAQRRQLLDRGARLLGVLQVRRPASRRSASHGRRPRPSRRWRRPGPAPAGPSASRTAATRARSSASAWPGSATLTFAVAQPSNAGTAPRPPPRRPTAGTVALTGTVRRARGAGQPVHAASTRGRQPARRTRRRRTRGTARTRPTRRAPQQDAPRAPSSRGSAPASGSAPPTRGEQVVEAGPVGRRHAPILADVTDAPSSSSPSVSEIFDPSRVGRGRRASSLTDITYHRARRGAGHGADRLRPARGAQRVPPAHRRRALPALDHARMTPRRRLRAAHRQRPVRQGRRLGVLLRRRPADPRPRRLPVRRGRDRRHRRRGAGQGRRAAGCTSSRCSG